MKYKDLTEAQKASVRIESGDTFVAVPDSLLSQMTFEYDGDNGDGNAIYWATYPPFVEDELRRLGI